MHSPHLSLPYILPSQAQKHVTHNDALRILDAVVQLVVIERNRTNPPAQVTEGDRYIVATGATGDWSGQDGTIAIAEGGGWLFVVPLPGWRAQVAGEAVEVVFDGSEWQIPSLDRLPGIGIETLSDEVNRLAVSSDATLFTHAGSGHQIKVNKSESSDAASLVFQTDWSGRAEIGTAWSDDLSINVSSDGVSFQQAMRVDHVSANVAVGTGTATERLTVSDMGPETSVLVRNQGGSDGASLCLVDDLSGADWKMMAASDGSLRIHDRRNSEDTLRFDPSGNVARFSGPVALPRFNVSELPDPSTSGAGAQIYVPDETGCAVPAFSDGIAWRRVTDRAIVS